MSFTTEQVKLAWSVQDIQTATTTASRGFFLSREVFVNMFKSSRFWSFVTMCDGGGSVERKRVYTKKIMFVS